MHKYTSPDVDRKDARAHVSPGDGADVDAVSPGDGADVDAAGADNPFGAVGASARWSGAGRVKVVVGPPGTGKSHYLLNVVVPEAVELYGGDAVRVVSLTTGAANELRSRESLLPEDQIMTLHALCKRALGAGPPADKGKYLEAWNVQCAAAHAVSEGSQAPGTDLKNQVELLRHSQTPVEAWPVRVQMFWTAWCKWKQADDLLDFTDWISRCLDDVPVAPGDPGCLVVDEAQDFSYLEMALIKSWGSRCEDLVVAGDFDQAIFAFKGADSRAFMALGASEENIVHLNQSYRVPRAVHAYAVGWIAQVQDRYPSPYKPKDEEGEVVRASALRLTSGPALVKALLAELAGPGEPVVMLAVMTERLARRPIADLTAAGIPFCNPYQGKLVWNPLQQVAAHQLRALLLPIRLWDGELVGTWTWTTIAEWIKGLDMSHADFLTGAKARATKFAIIKRPEHATRTEVRDVFTDEGWSGLLEALNGGAFQLADWHRARRLGSKHGSWLFLDRLLASHRREATEDAFVDALWDQPRLVVGTYHSVKGGEAEVVFLAPELSAPSARAMSKTGPEHRADRDEVLRVVYVGITRSSRKLVLLGTSKPHYLKWNYPGANLK